MKVTSHLLSIAKRHGCYKVMWTICCDINDSELLRNIMHESLGPNGGFSYYVFKKLHESKQFAELLRLGEEFPEELSIFLKDHPDLLWLHDLFLHQFTSASETLHALALSLLIIIKILDYNIIFNLIIVFWVPVTTNMHLWLLAVTTESYLWLPTVN